VPVWQFPPFRLDVANQCLYRDDVRISLMPKPFSILQYLVEHAGRLVTQDELLTAIWPETHVQPEVLRRYILEIRRALGDQPETPRFIETITKRGYRFIAEVTPVEPQGDGNPEAVPKRRFQGRTTALMTVSLIAGLAMLSGYLLSRSRPPGPGGKDMIVLAELTNTTGDPVFDGTLRQGLTVQLEQSPFLSVVPEERIQQTLRLMQRASDMRLTTEIAREACERIGGTIVLGGSIAQIGTQYSLILKAVNCSNGELVATTQAQASDKNHVLAALGRACSDIRKKLGESLATIQKFDTPLVQASTSSLEALHAYTLGYRQVVVKGDSAAAVPLLQRATMLDPKFAMAYSTLGLTYWNLGESNLAAVNIQRAFDLRAGLSEWEKLRIEAAYPSLVTKDLDKARRVYEVWAQTYPRDWNPRNHLGVIYIVLGEPDRALGEFREAVRLNSESGLVWGNLVAALVGLDRLAEARSIAHEAQSKNHDSPGLRACLYRIGFLQNDREEMKEQVEYGGGKPELERGFLGIEAATEAYFGHLGKARELYDRAVASAQRADSTEAAADDESDAALMEALFGNESVALRQARSALELSTGSDAQYRAAVSLSLAGDLARAQSIADSLNRRFPEDTIVQLLYLPALRAQVWLGRHEPAKAVEALKPALAYDLGGALYPAYVRGLAYVAAHNGKAAEREFQRILDHRGIVLNSPIGALAHLQIGRAYALESDVAKARTAYQEFLSLWGDSDAGIPVLTQARAELAKLKP